MVDSNPKIWVLIDDATGNSNQSIELAKKISDNYEIKFITYNKFAKLPNLFLGMFPIHVTDGLLKQLIRENPPEIIISAGRKIAALSVHLKKIFDTKSKQKVQIIQIMKPDLNPKKFDIIILPQHDNFNYVLPNIIRTIGSLTNVQEKIQHSVKKFEMTYPGMDKFIAVMIGGSNKNYNFTIQDAQKIVQKLKSLVQKKPLKLFVTFSRRTPEKVKNYIRNNILSPHMTYSPEDDDLNPYPAMLAKAEFIITTPDSVSMCSEAVSTGVPVYIYSMPKFTSKKHNYFVQQLVDIGAAKMLDQDTKTLQKYDYQSLNELERISQIIKEKYLTKL